MCPAAQYDAWFREKEVYCSPPYCKQTGSFAKQQPTAGKKRIPSVLVHLQLLLGAGLCHKKPSWQMYCDRALRLVVLNRGMLLQSFTLCKVVGRSRMASASCHRSAAYQMAYIKTKNQTHTHIHMEEKKSPYRNATWLGIEPRTYQSIVPPCCPKHWYYVINTFPMRWFSVRGYSLNSCSLIFRLNNLIPQHLLRTFTPCFLCCVNYLIPL